MNQGATSHREYWRTSPRRHGLTIDNETVANLVDESMAIRSELPAHLVAGTGFDMDLGSESFLPRAYEAGDIASLRYDTAALPAEEQLTADLLRFLRIYEAAVAARSRLTAANPQRFRIPVQQVREESENGDGVFRPKDFSDYLAQIAAHTQVRTRRHEAVVASFGAHARALGWRVRSDVHPRDLTLTGDSGQHVLCEVKMVRLSAQNAVREAIGQLFTYRYFLYPAAPPALLAVFSESIGDAFVDLLEQLGVASVWSEGGGSWRGSSLATSLGVALPLG
jgi:hypothetical protein